MELNKQQKIIIISGIAVVVLGLATTGVVILYKRSKNKPPAGTGGSPVGAGTTPIQNTGGAGTTPIQNTGGELIILDGTWSDEKNFATPHIMNINNGVVSASAGGSGGFLSWAGGNNLKFNGVLSGTFDKDNINFSNGVTWIRKA